LRALDLMRADVREAIRDNRTMSAEVLYKGTFAGDYA
jgi:hypothetical protein